MWPGLALLILLFLRPRALLLIFILWRTDTNFHVVPDWNVNNYARFFTVPTYLRTFAKTLAMQLELVDQALERGGEHLLVAARGVSRVAAHEGNAHAAQNGDA